MKKLLGVFALVGVATIALSTGGILKAFHENYKVKEDSTIGKAKCTLCHTTSHGGKLNPFGLDLSAALKKAGVKKPTAAIFASIEKMDSNKNGVSNGDEIKKDQLPGAAK